MHGQPLYLLEKNRSTIIHQTIFTEIIGTGGNRYQLNYHKLNFNDKLQVTIPRYFAQKAKAFGDGPVDLSHSSIVNINYHLNELFEETLVKYYHVHNSTLGCGVEKSIQLFYNQFGLDESMISADALIKIIQRRRKSISQQSTVHSPQ
jgi:hypothetical protein